MIEHEVDLRYDGQQWPVRAALGTTGFDAKAARLCFNIDAVLRIVCRPETLLKRESKQ